jgi:hypothetical protein
LERALIRATGLSKRYGERLALDEVDFEPKWMQTAALALPTTWAMAAFNDLTIRWLPATTAVVPSLVDFGFGAIYAVVGTVLVYRRF